MERFAEKFIVDPNSGCWIWQRAVDRKGYARFGLDGRNRTAHIVSYELFVGAVPDDGLMFDHTCNNKRCVNPDHLERVTNAENTRRGKALKPHVTHCPQDHPYSGPNLYITTKGYVSCRACARDSQERYRQRKRDKGEIGLPRAARTHCPQGHEYDESNTYRNADGHRACRACKRERARERRAASFAL